MNTDALHGRGQGDSAVFDGLTPELVVLPEHLREYRQKSDALRDELIYFHANLRLLSQIQVFPSVLFEAPPALLSYLAQNLTSECVHICYRTWLDQKPKHLTLPRLRAWLTNTAVRPEYRDDLRKCLGRASPSNKAKAVAKDLMEVRHAYLAHLDYTAVSGIKSVPKAVNITDLRLLADELGSLFNAMLFGATQMFVPSQFHSADDLWYEGDLGYVLEQVALGSKWFTVPLEDPDFFARIMRPQLTDEDLRVINTLRKRNQMEPLE